MPSRDTHVAKNKNNLKEISLALGFTSQAASTMTAGCATKTKFMNDAPLNLPTGMRSIRPEGKEKREGRGGYRYPERQQNDQVVGEGEDKGRGTAREWRLLGPSPLRAKIHMIKNQAPEYDRRRITSQGGRGREKRNTEVRTTIETPRGQQGPGLRTRETRGGERTRDTTEESGTRRGEQRRAAEDGRWRVWEKSRWILYHEGREGGEWVYRDRSEDDKQY